MSDNKLDATFHGDDGVASVALLTFADQYGNEWIAGAALTRIRRAGAVPEAEFVSIQLTEENCSNWKLKGFKVVTP